jgi:hypothetical protein
VTQKGDAVALGEMALLALHSDSMPGIDVALAPSVHPALPLVFLERGRSIRPCNKGTVRGDAV